MTEAAHIAIVEDDPGQRLVLASILEQSGLHPVPYSSAGEFLRRRGQAACDAVLLDWNMPDMSGLELLRLLREQGGGIPVLFITANDAAHEVVTGLEAGADDYIVKPADPGVLVARLQVCLRRSGGRQPLTAESTAPFEFDADQRSVRLNGEVVELTDREYDLLRFMFQRIGRIVSREALLRQVWNTSADLSTRTIDTYVSRLRKRLGLQGDSGWKLEGIYQHGYRLVRTAAQPAQAANG
jgi:DNA-binding response OmpR family regulator